MLGIGYWDGSPGLFPIWSMDFFILFRTPAGCGNNVRLTNGSIYCRHRQQCRDSGRPRCETLMGTPLCSNPQHHRRQQSLTWRYARANRYSLDKYRSRQVYQVIAQVNQSEQDKHPEVLTGPTILGPQIEKMVVIPSASR